MKISATVRPLRGGVGLVIHPETEMEKAILIDLSMNGDLNIIDGLMHISHIELDEELKPKEKANATETK